MQNNILHIFIRSRLELNSLPLGSVEHLGRKEGRTDVDLSFQEQVHRLKTEPDSPGTWGRLGFCSGCCRAESWGLCAVKDNEQQGLGRKEKIGLKIQRRPDRSKEGYGQFSP